MRRPHLILMMMLSFVCSGSAAGLELTNWHTYESDRLHIRIEYPDTFKCITELPLPFRSHIWSRAEADSIMNQWSVKNLLATIVFSPSETNHQAPLIVVRVFKNPEELDLLATKEQILRADGHAAKDLYESRIDSIKVESAPGVRIDLWRIHEGKRKLASRYYLIQESSQVYSLEFKNPEDRRNGVPVMDWIVHSESTVNRVVTSLRFPYVYD